MLRTKLIEASMLSARLAGEIGGNEPMFHKRQPKQGGAIVPVGSVARRAPAVFSPAVPAQMELAEIIKPSAS
jgi:hypothetical protein